MSYHRLCRGLALPVRWLSHWSGNAMRQIGAVRLPRILMYHVIGDGELSVRQFAWQLAFLREHFEPVALGELVDRMRDRAVTGREVAVTFDDGVRNHFEMAWPLLRHHRVPATFFVCSDLIESDAMMWRNELRLRLASLDEAERRLLVGEANGGKWGVEQIMEWTKTLDMDQRRAFESRVLARTPQFSASREQLELHAPLTWDQLRQLDENLITIGSHTCAHPILTKLDAKQLHDEIAVSRRVLERGLQRKVDLFSYPNGVHDPTVVGEVRRNYRAAVCTRKGFVGADADPLLLPRISGEGSRAMFVRRLHRPGS
ncbi:MAG TPA: polysaccharide deacetylase family protein [Rhodanobacteraceae bacterium]|nr:polysaccharide deacetylase family protein [Rhodanobacteraceae bacterium]